MTPLEEYLAAVRKSNALNYEPAEIWIALLRIGAFMSLASLIVGILIWHD